MESSVTDDTPKLAEYRKMFVEARDLTVDARREAQIDGDYFDGFQWTAAERKVLRDRKQPDNVFNRIKPAVLGTIGVIEQGQTDPRAFGRNPQDDDAADVASKVLRFIADYNNFDSLRSDFALDYLKFGIGAEIIEVDADKRVTATQVRWEEFFFDPRSRRRDFEDASYLGIAKWMYADDVKALYPHASKALDASMSGDVSTVFDDTYEDRPKDAQSNWIDRGKRRVMVVEVYHRKRGAWYRCVFWNEGKLEEGLSPYLDEKKKPACPIVAMSCFIDRENNRYGIIRDMRGPQDEINKRRSKLLHLLNNRQMIASRTDQFFEQDVELVRKESARPDGVIPPGWSPAPLTEMTAGQFQLLGESKDEIERMGPNPATLGRQGSDSSGRALLARQQAGMVEQAYVFAGIQNWELRSYRMMWARAKQFWTAPDYVRVTDDVGAPQYIGINQPQYGEPQVVMGPTGMPTIARPIMGYENALAEIDVDITLDSVPDTATIQQEQFQMLVELAKVYPNDVTFDDLLEASSMPNKRQIIEKRKERAEQAGQMGQVAQQIQMKAAAADIAKTEAEAGLKAAQTQNELMKPQVEAVKAFAQGQSVGAAQ